MQSLMESKWPDIIIDEETTKWYNSQVPTDEERAKELKEVMGYMLGDGMERRFCHNDCNPTNLLYDEENDKVTLVDFEMCGLGKTVGDLCNVLFTTAAGMAPEPDAHYHSLEIQREVTRTYLTELKRLDEPGSDVTDEEVERLRNMAEAYFICGGFFFHIIAARIASQAAQHMDPKIFLGLSIARLQWYQKNKDKMLQLGPGAQVKSPSGAAGSE